MSAQLLVQARGGLARAAGGRAGSARSKLRAAGLARGRGRRLVLGAGVAVAEVLGEVEASASRPAARSPRRRRGGPRSAPPSPPASRARARGCRAAAARRRRASCARGSATKRVLQPRARRRVGVDVAGRHARHAEPRGERRQAAVERAVVARERALQLDAEARRARRPRSSRRIVGSSRTPWRAQPLRQTSPSACSSTSASVTLGGMPRCGAVRVARVRVRAREQPAEVAPSRARRGRAASGGDGRRRRAVVAEASAPRRGSPAARAPSAACANSIEPQTRVVVGQRQRRVPALERRRHELLGQRGAVEEREGGVAVELDVRRHEHMFAYRSRRTQRSRPGSRRARARGRRRRARGRRRAAASSPLLVARRRARCRARPCRCDRRCARRPQLVRAARGRCPRLVEPLVAARRRRSTASRRVRPRVAQRADEAARRRRGSRGR